MTTYESARNARDFMLEVARGFYENVSHFNKFGRSTNVDNGVTTDIWDGANATDDIDIWVAPTTVRGHNIASSSANDTSGGTGARTIRIYGLTDWNLDRVTEDISMNGTTDVPTVNAYVIIDRMVVLTKGATDVNIGKITATAAGDNTVTAQILASEGSTQMAIFGVPSIMNAYITRLYANTIAASTGSEIKAFLKANLEPEAELTNFLTEHTFGLKNTGTSAFLIPFQPYKKIEGPAIMKVQVVGDANNMDISAGFDIILVKEP